jgi:Flp pilus assembly protein TadB
MEPMGSSLVRLLWLIVMVPLAIVLLAAMGMPAWVIAVAVVLVIGRFLFGKA